MREPLVGHKDVGYGDERQLYPVAGQQFIPNEIQIDKKHGNANIYNEPRP